MKRNKSVLAIILIAIIIAVSIRFYSTSIESDNTSSNVLLNTSQCEAQGGQVVFGIGPAPVCEEGQTSLGDVGGTNSIEGAICCR